MRLGDSVVPTAYALALTIDPAQPRHSGTVEIDLRLRQPSTQLRLHAKDVEVRQAWLDLGARRLVGQVRRLDPDNIALSFGRPLPVGVARLGLKFEGALQDKDVYGLFRQQEHDAVAASPANPAISAISAIPSDAASAASGTTPAPAATPAVAPAVAPAAPPTRRWYAMTQFEPVGARLAFPLFDEPGFKVPWSLTLTVPQDLLTVANMPIANEAPAEPGWKTVRFETTPPLPSYLLGFAVGPFSVLNAGTTGPTSATPMRFIAARGGADDARYAASVTGPIVEQLEAYFGLPHPYPKLDSLAIPVTANFGAMEHAGLITYEATLMLAPKNEATPKFQRHYVATAAHELAHQWFGNLVTMAWWNDLWLNESFASWMGDRITAQLRPDWGWDTRVQDARQYAMRADRLVSARRIAEPVRNLDELAAVWDSITYLKGQTVLAMFEQYLGADKFQAGVRRYMQRHAWGHATGDDFLAALAVEDPTVPAALRSFTQQSGIPRISADVQCEPNSPPRLRLRQSRLLPLGSAALPAGTPPSVWQVPMLIRTPQQVIRYLFDQLDATLLLPDTTCPAWVQANVGGQGYYRVAYGAGAFSTLMGQANLAVAERLAGLDDARGLSEAGDLPASELLALASAQAQHPDRRVVEQAITTLRAAHRLVTPAQLPAYAAHWQRALGERGRALGWQAQASDSDDTRLLRAELLPVLADLGDDAELRRQATLLAQRWLTAPASLEAAQRGAVLSSAALAGDSALFDAYRAALAASQNRAERQDLLAALGAFKAPDLAARALALLLDPAVDIREAQRPIMSAHNADPALREGLLNFIQMNFGALVKTLGRDEPTWLPSYVNQGCNEADAQRMEAVFRPQAAKFPGGVRALTQALESVRMCAAWRARQPEGWLALGTPGAWRSGLAGRLVPARGTFGSG